MLLVFLIYKTFLINQARIHKHKNWNTWLKLSTQQLVSGTKGCMHVWLRQTFWTH